MSTTSPNGQYDAAPADAHLEAALAKLRANTGEFKPRLLRDEAAALLAELERLQRELKALQRRVDRQYGREAMERLLPP